MISWKVGVGSLIEEVVSQPRNGIESLCIDVHLSFLESCGVTSLTLNIYRFGRSLDITNLSVIKTSYTSRNVSWIE
jgi:hypothetical protein